MLVTMGRHVACAGVSSANTSAVADENELVPCLLVDGPPIRAGLDGFDATGNVRLLVPDANASGSRVLTKSFDDFVCWGTCPDLQPSEDYLYLADGTLLSGGWQGLDNGTLRWRHARIGNLQMTTEQAAGLVIAAPYSNAARDRLLDRIAAGSAEHDRLILTNGDELRGRILRSESSVVRILSDFGAVDVPASRVAAVAFRGPGVRRSVSGAVSVALEDGSRLVVDRSTSGRYPLEIDPKRENETGAAFLHQVRLGDRVTQPDAWEFTAAVKYLHAFGPRIDYLSDLSPMDYVHVPYLTYAQPLGRDRTPRGAYLRSGKALYLKGLGTYSACRATYDLAKQYRRFCAEVVMDDVARGRGDAACRVVLDGTTAWRIESLRSADFPVAVDVNVAGAERLDLIVEFGPRADELDYVDWLNARLVR
ncbi:hypothetical protein JCM17478_04770 [Thermopirellula anaerolimosa]